MRPPPGRLADWGVGETVSDAGGLLGSFLALSIVGLAITAGLAIWALIT